ncbi:hypothetical protein LMG7974_01725 [Campylobacter majalis]|uniref:Helicase ATP-binding domain-containing protein n=1 Tax=Campylobacter majalis TaxID=2790656 RepID=A0ABM8Q9I1_9BACT|nr:DEAD/DEAH box helicase family protein [Campylobacter majalis]CAD7289648.1 hypothetical protein LMG7974_01725 [Campylobacter majalis]
MAKLSDELKNALKYSDIKIPAYISENLKHELREYQESALKHYILQRKAPHTNHLLFNMATGSGKTMIMAALMLDLFKNGYRNFVFFVNSTAILQKTMANFTDSFSSKYLFKDRILIDEKQVQIRAVRNFDESKDDAVNIVFITIQGLFSLFKDERENSLSISDLAKEKIVFIADEAHHLNADTKKNKKESELKEGWESVVNKAFGANSENFMLEFTATVPNQKEVVQKYEDKIAYEYALKEFCKDGYSKNITLLKYENADINRRFLGAVLASLYRQMTAFKNGIGLKPVILFKSETIAASNDNEAKFNEFIQSIDGDEIEKFYSEISANLGDMLYKSYECFKGLGESWYSKTAMLIRENFKSEFILNVNKDEELNKNQILLNSLEDDDNYVRVIFAVDKLNEGWDVLNLFDIVRLSDKISSKGHTSPTSEVQLIGRGARYYPFYEGDMRYKRKFDDLSNELCVIETLSYHTLNQNSFISSLNHELIKQGLIASEAYELVEFKPTKRACRIAKTDKIYYIKNERYKKGEIFKTKMHMQNLQSEISTLFMPFISDAVLENAVDFKKYEQKDHSYKTDSIKNRIDYIVFLKALNVLELGLKQINENFSFDSKEAFWQEISSVKVNFVREQKFSRENQLKLMIYILNHYKSLRQKIKSEYEVSEFRAYRLEQTGVRKMLKKKDKVKTHGYEWLYYDKYCDDSELELGFLKFIDGYKTKLDKKFASWIVVRNDGFDEFKIYGKDAIGFEPDFIMFAKLKGDDKFLGLECIFEPKGEHLAGKDGWKEELLKSLDSKKFEFKNDELKIVGFPFYLKNDNEKFKKKWDEFLNASLGL